jgi:hypothetical protein
MQMAKQLVTAVKIMPVQEAVTIPFFSHLMEDGIFKSNEGHDKSVVAMLDELLRWTDALQVLRAG